MVTKWVLRGKSSDPTIAQPRGLAFAGLCSGFAIWWPTDRLVPVPYVVFAATLAVTAVSLVAALAVRKVSLSDEKLRGAVGLVLVCCAAFGPVAVAVTPPLVAYRVARNDRAAAERFASLKNAVERTVAEGGDPGRICEGQALRRHYSGPPFREDDWRFIAGNYVREQGYSFIIFCHEKSGYTIQGIPREGKGDGTRQFCTDESGEVGCGMEWNRSRNACIPCAK